jgi:hypothetical protein
VYAFFRKRQTKSVSFFLFVRHLIRSAEDGGDDRKVTFPHTLYGVVDDRVFELGRGSGLHRELLNTSSVYVLDCNERVFVWAGKSSTEAEQVVACKNKFYFCVLVNIVVADYFFCLWSF